MTYGLEAASLETLAARAAAGDSVALDALVRALEDDFYNLSMRMLGHPQDAEDATQEILVRRAPIDGSCDHGSSIVSRNVR